MRLDKLIRHKNGWVRVCVGIHRHNLCDKGHQAQIAGSVHRYAWVKGPFSLVILSFVLTKEGS
jgi:hypothetical protein